MSTRIFNLSSDDESSSQNFRLKLTNSIIIDETLDESNVNNLHDKKNDDEIIIIHDSSDDESPVLANEKSKKDKLPICDATTYLTKTHSSSISSFDVSKIFTQDESRNLWNTAAKPSSNKPKNYESLISNDSSIKGVIASKTNNNKCKFDNDNINLLSNNKENVCHANIISNNDVMKQSNHKNVELDAIKSHKSNENIINKHDDKPFGTPNSQNRCVRTTPLTKREARKILKTVKAQRIVYDSPNQWLKNRHKSDSESDSNEDGDYTPGQRLIHPAYIEETESESDSPKHTINPQNIQKPQQLNPDKNIADIMDQIKLHTDSLQCPERKRHEIAHWLMANSFNRRSDSSVSYIPPTENSVNSGNSSLERLEENYATPNNREKFQNKRYFDEQSNSKTNSVSRLISSTKPRPTLTESSTKKTKDKDKDNDIAGHKKHTPIQPLSKTAVDKSQLNEQVPNVANCANILDKIYGSTWRDRADTVLTSTTSEFSLGRQAATDRKMNPKLKERFLQRSYSSSADKRLNIFAKKATNAKNLNTNVNTRHVNNNKKTCDFIKDSTSESDGETTYLTALTTFETPRNRPIKKTVMSSLTQKAIDLCDSDTDDDDDDNVGSNNNERRHDNYRRRLDYSDQEKSSSNCTSEYDPDDVIPPKITPTPTQRYDLSNQKTLSVKQGTLSTLGSLGSFSKSNTKISFLKSLSASVPITYVHPQAKKYRVNYKTTKEELCKYLFHYYNEKIFENKLPKDMLIEWSARMRGTAGYCFNKTKRKAFGDVERSSRIQLATKVLDSPERLRDTLLHEMCHAATWIINHVSNGHGAFWRSWASKAMNNFPELPPIKRCHDYKIATKYTYRCITCGYSIGRHSKSLNTAKKRCGHCFGKFELLVNKTTKSGTVQHKVDDNKNPTGFALYVKENYHSVKSKYQDIDHKEVMKVLGQQFSTIKISRQNSETN